jgi:hypothetical protein
VKVGPLKVSSGPADASSWRRGTVGHRTIWLSRSLLARQDPGGSAFAEPVVQTVAALPVKAITVIIQRAMFLMAASIS